MRFLLDTHTFLWFIKGEKSLSSYSRQQIEDSENERFLSVASLWEMAIKISLGKLNIKFDFTELYTKHILGNAITILEILPNHFDILKILPFYHKDPFDRMLIAQSIAEVIPILSKDELFDEYKDVKRFW